MGSTLPPKEGVRASSEPLWEGSRDSVTSGEWQVHLFIVSFSYCKHLSAPWQVRDLPHAETLFPYVPLPTLAAQGNGGMRLVPWFVTHPTGQRTDVPMALLVLTIYGGQRMPATGAPVHRHRAMVAQSTVFWSLTAKS